MSVILECNNLTKKFANLTAIDDVTIKLKRGRIIGLLGPNGSGKSTLIKLINGLLVANSGSLLINGKAPGIETKKIISYLPERSYLPEWMKVSETIDYFMDFYDDFDKNKAYDMLDKLNLDPNMKMKTLSKGTKEKVQLILVMSRDADLYCLDEPIGGVDPAARDYILDTIISNYNDDSTVLISTHLISDVENILDEFVFIREGQVMLQSEVDDTRSKEGKSIDALFREVFKC